MRYKKLFISLAGLVILIAVAFAGWIVFAPGGGSVMTEQFTVPLGSVASPVPLAVRLGLLLRGKTAADVQPGGYLFSAGMSIWQVAGVLAGPPVLKWVVIPEGLRKEQIGDLLAATLGWTDAQRQEFDTTDTSMPDYVEGVYFPDTYLMPATSTPAGAANRLRAQFNESFAPYAAQALQKNIRWTTALKVASLIQREAGSAADMPLISGIIWNRLLADMPLGIDATLQYIKGTEGNWWPPISPADEQLASPYNTYKYAGLPPTPIDNPGLTAISAALNPATTTCYYYLYDSSGLIHCADTYAEHEANVQKYLQ